MAQKYWAEKIAETEAALKKTTSQQAYQELERKLQWLKETEMAVVISQWPMGSQSPMKFISQKKSGELVEYCFEDVDTKSTRIVKQFV